MEVIRHNYPALQFNPGLEPTVKARCGDMLFNIPMRVFSLCDKLAADLNWKIMEKSTSDYVIVDPLSYVMDPKDVKQFYEELSDMCSHALYATGSPVVDTDVYGQVIWNKIAYAAQYGARLYLKRALDSIITLSC